MIYHFGQAPAITLEQAGILAGIILPGFILIAALMTLVGVSVTDMREAQQVSLMFTLPMVAPYWFAGAVLQHPENPLAVILSLFPLTAVVTMPLRMSISSVPLWQALLAAGLMWGAAIGALHLAARTFHMGMLQYTRRIPLKNILKRPQP
jgi:ABC-2 type transport system permease protein